MTKLKLTKALKDKLYEHATTQLVAPDLLAKMNAARENAEKLITAWMLTQGAEPQDRVTCDRYGVAIKPVIGVLMPKYAVHAEHGEYLAPPLVPHTCTQCPSKWAGQQWTVYWHAWAWQLPQTVWLPDFAPHQQSIFRRRSDEDGYWFSPHQPDSYANDRLHAKVCTWSGAMRAEVVASYQAGHDLLQALKPVLADFALVLKQAKTLSQVAAVYAPTMIVAEAHEQVAKPPAIQVPMAGLRRIRVLSENPSPVTNLVAA